MSKDKFPLRSYVSSRRTIVQRHPSENLQTVTWKFDFLSSSILYIVQVVQMILYLKLFFWYFTYKNFLFNSAAGVINTSSQQRNQ